MGKKLNVLMMGGQRAGKSSALAAIIDSFVNGPVRSILTAEDVTVLQKQDGIKQNTIKAKLKEVKNMLTYNVGKTILVDSGKTNIIWHYNIEFSLPDSTNKLTMQFTDVNGEFFEEESMQRQTMMDMISSYDVFIVAIDTTFMMEARKNRLVDSAINERFNCIESIHTFLTMIQDAQNSGPKLVMFVPIKCELWAHQGLLDLVVRRVEEDYATAINALRSYKDVQVEILPIQTIGSIDFVEHKEAFLFDWVKTKWLLFNKTVTSKCSIKDDYTVRLEDGTFMPKSMGNLREDESAVLIPGTCIVRPNSWFKVNSTEYRPHNCEQLAFHILEFMCGRIVDERIREIENRDIIDKGFNWLLDVITLGNGDAVKDIFGSISLETMLNVIKKIKETDLVRYEGEGITVIKKCNFKNQTK